MVRTTKANINNTWRRRVGRTGRVEHRRRGQRRVNNRMLEETRRINTRRISGRNPSYLRRVESGLENTISVGARRPTNAQMVNVMKKGKIPKTLRIMLLLAMSNPYTGSTKEAMNATSYIQAEINKEKRKKNNQKQ